jgi:hypothetical protein
MCEHSDIKGFNVFCFVFFSSTEPKATSCSTVASSQHDCKSKKWNWRYVVSLGQAHLTSEYHHWLEAARIKWHCRHIFMCPQIALETIPLQSGAFNSHGAFYTKCEKCWVNLRVNFSSCVICIPPTIWWLDTQMVPLIKYQKCSIMMSNEAIIKWHHDLTQIIWQSFYSNHLTIILLKSFDNHFTQIHDCLVHKPSCRKWLQKSKHIGPWA